MIEKATFAAGCFWGVEATYRQLEGIIETQVGYTGGNKDNPSYEEVCNSSTGHAEALEIKFDTDKLSYEELVFIFFRMHDPTQLNRQGPDVGTQYRSVIFYHSPKQKAISEAIISKLQKIEKFSNRKIVTQVLRATKFYRAEEYHQKFFDKNGFHPCVNYLKLPEK